jgi:hypothetical protein
VRLIAQSARPQDPERVTQRAFDAAREASGHEGVPKATTICARLADRDGKPMPWREVLERALDESASPEHAERRRLGEPEAAHLDVRHVIYALRIAAGRREAKSLTPDEYEDERREILGEEARRRGLRRHLQAELLPTVGQVEWLMRDSSDRSMAAPWDAALAIAELEPRSDLRDQRRHRGRRPDSLPLVEAIHHYVEANGTLPSREQFKEFRRLADVKVETRSGGWTDALKATIEYRAGLGLAEPTEMPATGKPPAGASRQVKIPAGGIPGAAPGAKKGKSKYAEADCIEAVRRYLGEDDGPHNQKGYLLFAGRHKLPAPSYFGDHGGWLAVRRKAKAEARRR